MNESQGECEAVGENTFPQRASLQMMQLICKKFHKCHLSLNVYLPVTAAKCLIGRVIREPLPRAVESAAF